MADAKKCDRCGAFYLHADVLGQYTFGKKQFSRLDVGDSNMSKYKALDLCPECIQSFLKWFEEGGMREDQPDI